MDYSDAVLGQYAARTLREKMTGPVLIIGTDRFARHDLASVECFNFVAAANLTAALKPFALKSTRDLFDRVAPTDLAVPRVGTVALAVLGAAFEAKGLGGSAPLENWAKHHLARDARLVTFGSLKTIVAKTLERRRNGRRRKKG